jgi:hypothetical protein
LDTFTLVKSALAKSADDDDKRGLDLRTIEIGRITAAVQTVVDALTPPDGGRYVVGFVDMQTAATDLQARRIIVSSKPLQDRNLSLVEKAVVVATFAAHEIGHTIVTRPRADLIRQHNPKSGFHAVANLADDIILEPFMVDRFPILADAFAFTGEWVLRNTAKSLPRVEAGGWTTTPERFNTLISATRYGDTAPIVWTTASAMNERAWGRSWAERLCAADLRDHATFLALCDEAWDRIRSRDEDDAPVDEPPPGDEPGDGEDGDDQGQPGGDPGPSTDDEPGDEQGEDEGEGGSGESDDEDGDEDGEQGDEPGDESEDGDESGEDDGDGDEDGDDEGNPGGDESGGTDDGGGSMDWGDESDAEGDDDGEPGDGDDPGDGSDDEDADGDPGMDGEGGGGNASANGADLRDEDEWNDDDVDQTTHTEAHKQRWDYDGDTVEQAARTYQNTGTTAFGRHGKITTTWS